MSLFLFILVCFIGIFKVEFHLDYKCTFYFCWFFFENYLLPHKVLKAFAMAAKMAYGWEIGGVYDNIHDVVLY
jgi:hypothetical protein